MVEPATILVVDDEPFIRFLLAEELTERGYEVAMAASGEEAVALLHKAAYDLILLDLKMPGMDGVEVMREVRNLAPDTQVIMLTAHATLDSAVEALRYGGHDYLLKPSSTEEILSSVEKGLEKRRQRLRQEELIRQMGDIARQLADSEGEPSSSDARTDEPSRYVRVGDLLLDRAKLSVTSSGESIRVTPSEFKLLLCLMENAGSTVGFRQLAEAIHGRASDDRSAKDAVSTHMWRLRRKLEATADSLTQITNVRGEGYVLRAS